MHAAVACLNQWVYFFYPWHFNGPPLISTTVRFLHFSVKASITSFCPYGSVMSGGQILRRHKRGLIHRWRWLHRRTSRHPVPLSNTFRESDGFLCQTVLFRGLLYNLHPDFLPASRLHRYMFFVIHVITWQPINLCITAEHHTHAKQWRNIIKCFDFRTSTAGSMCSFGVIAEDKNFLCFLGKREMCRVIFNRTIPSSAISWMVCWCSFVFVQPLFLVLSPSLIRSIIVKIRSIRSSITDSSIPPDFTFSRSGFANL